MPVTKLDDVITGFSQFSSEGSNKFQSNPPWSAATPMRWSALASPGTGERSRR
jgi:hypothetical protein